MVSITIDILSGPKPLIVDVRQTQVKPQSSAWLSQQSNTQRSVGTPVASASESDPAPDSRG
jgi:hypothetical protein